MRFRMGPRRPDPDSLRYAQHWEPVLAGPSRGLLARLSVEPGRYLDVGAGTGGLILAAAERWPHARIGALDASAGMLSVAHGRVQASAGLDPGRFEWWLADAADMPLDDGSVDLVSSAFLLQLVSDRPAVLAEMRRVLRPGGTLGLVSWLAGEALVPADEVFAEVASALGLPLDAPGSRSSRAGDYDTPDELREELAAAGFGGTEVSVDELRHAWTREGYLDFKEHFDERDHFASLDDAARDGLRAALRERWAILPENAFELRGSIVVAVTVPATRP